MSVGTNFEKLEYTQSLFQISFHSLMNKWYFPVFLVVLACLKGHLALYQLSNRGFCSSKYLKVSNFDLRTFTSRI